MLHYCTFRSFLALFAAVLLGACAGGSTGSAQLTVSPTSPPPPTGLTGVAYPSFTFVAPTGGVGPFTWTESGALPQGMSLSPSGQLSGTPATAGTFTFTVAVSDSSMPTLTAQESVTLVINDSVLAINTAAAPPAGTFTQPYPSYTFSASGGSQPLSWSVTAGSLPPGLALDAGGSLSGAPIRPGTYTFTVTVTESAQNPQTKSAVFTISVADSQITITPSPAGAPQAGTVTHTYPDFTFSAIGGFPPFTWSVTAGALPPGLSLSSTGTLSGTPTGAGSFPFTVTVADSASPPGTGSLPVTLVISNPGPVAIVQTPAPAAATSGRSYGWQFTATGGYLPLSWAVTAGALPPGLTLSSSGGLTGTPTTTGSSTFTLAVTDSGPTPTTNSAPFTIVVNDPPPPVVIIGELPIATVGTPYTYTFTATGGLAPFVWSATGTPQSLGLSLGGVLSGTPTGAGMFPISVSVRDSLNRTSPSVPFTVRIALARSGGFTPTGSLMVARSGHTATLLSGGKVLVTGGSDSNGLGLASAELYDPATGMFTTAGHMTEPRWLHTATVLGNAALKNFGKVLIVGSVDATAELYDPVGGTYAATGSMAAPRTRPTATVLDTGKVLVAGGNQVGVDAELYDPATEAFTDAGPMTIFRVGHTATLLLDGRVLIAGGGNFGGGKSATAELYDPATGKFAATGNMTTALTGHTATRLQDGTVLVVGPDGSTDLYDPGSGSFTAVGSPTPYTVTVGSFRRAQVIESSAHSASLRSDGSVLVAGGDRLVYGWVYNMGTTVCEYVPFPYSVTTTALFAPEAEGFTATGLLNEARDGHSSTVLSDGTVLVVGGLKQTAINSGNCSGYGASILRTATALSSAELFK
jgi:hypothetical protein